jgi:acetyltransferase-like isoleucine patch superfamily enzyme
MEAQLLTPEQLLHTAEQLRNFGLVAGKGEGLLQRNRWETPAFLLDARRVKNCEIGAFTYVNGFGTSSLYETRIGRYCSIAEGVIVGPYEHPLDGLTSHSIAYGGREELPTFYHLPEYARAAPDRAPHGSFMGSGVQTHVGHDVWIGAASLIKRGVRIGNGAVIAAHAVVTKDVEPYTIVAGTPAKPMRKRFPDALIERMERVAWWQYDLAPFKDQIDYRSGEAGLDAVERLLDEGRLSRLDPVTWEIQRRPGTRFAIRRLPAPLF